VEGCHNSEADADDQLAALNASEGKEVAGVLTTPPEYMQDAAQRGLDLHEEGMGGEGLEQQTVEEARQIARGEALSRNKIEKGDGFYGRNESSYCPLSEASDAQRTSMLLWGGCDAGSWYSRKNQQIDEAMQESAFDRLESLLKKADATDLSEGDLVSWSSSGGTAYGRVQEVAMGRTVRGSLEPSGTTHDTSEDNPGVIIELITRDDEGEVVGEGETVFHRPETLTMIESSDVPEEAAAPQLAERKSAVGERRTMGFETKDFEVKQDEEDQEFVFAAYGAVFGNKDRGGDILQRGAFKRTIDQNDGRFPLVADHNLGDMGSRLGVAYAKEDSHGVRVKGHVNTDTQAGREVASHIRHAEKHDLALGMSFGYKVRDDDFDSDKNARLLKEVENYEFTVTQIPMNPEARVQGVKGLLDDERALEELERELKSRLLSDEDFVSRLSEKRRDSEPAANSGAGDAPTADLEAELTQELLSLKSELESNA
jgi:HK97 family phage prohead protease